MLRPDLKEIMAIIMALIKIMLTTMTELHTVDNGLFYVVDFFDGIQIIPDKWVLTGDETLTYWPIAKSDKDYDTLVYNRSSVKDNWTLEPIKTILYKTDSFLKAKLKLKKAEYQSDVDSACNTDERKKQRRDNAKIQFSDDNEEHIRGKKRKLKPKLTNLPPLPQAPDTAVYNKASTSKTLSCSAVDIQLLTFGNQKENVPISRHLSDNSDSEEQICEKRREEKSKLGNLPSLPQVSDTAVHNKDSTAKTLSCSAINKKSLSSESQNQNIAILPPDNDKEIMYKILRVVESLKISMNGLTALVRESIQRLDTVEKNIESFRVQSVLDEYDNIVGVFPIKNAASLKEVENLIANNNAFKATVIKSLTQVTCTDMKKTIRNILHFLISDEIAQQYSWLGKRCKAAFHDLQISNILKLVVTMRHQDVTSEQISSIVAEWLKHAKQRAHRQSEKEKQGAGEILPLSSEDSEHEDSY